MEWQKIEAIYRKQEANRWRMAATTAAERAARLRRLRDALWARRPELQRALWEDFRKPAAETDLTEVLPVVAEINHTVRHLSRWMRPRSVKTPLLLMGTKSRIRCEARGLVLILSPWNYPVNLLLNPLVAALAAGNCVLLKPSGKVPRTVRFLATLIADLFPPEEVALVEGGHETADALLEMRFDHIFFTGSPAVGRHVMAAAARHLTPVTLELGGKSPAIVDGTADIAKAAERIIWGKCLNAGQTCVAPDYLLIQEDRLEAFLVEARRVIESRYGVDAAARIASPDFSRLVSEGHQRRLAALLEAAVAQGARIAFGGAGDAAERYIEPTLVTGMTVDSPLMGEELFGPVLPILTFSGLYEAIDVVRTGERPLALYLFSKEREAVERVLAGTSAGGSCVNGLILHLANPDLPFGGVGQSGMGSYHGFTGFRALSHERSVLTQGRLLDGLRLFYPPYTGRVGRLLELAVKYLS